MEQDAEGLAVRSAREGKPLEEMELRETGEARAAILDLVRAIFAGLPVNSLTQPDLEDPHLVKFKTQYDALSEENRTCGKGVMTWEQVVAAIPDADEFLVGVESLSEAEVYWLDENGQLVVGDGCAEPAQETFGPDGKGLNYNDSRTAAVSVPNRGLITFGEYKRKNKGQFELEKEIWLENGEITSVSRKASWRRGKVRWEGKLSRVRHKNWGSRRVVRVKLNLES